MQGLKLFPPKTQSEITSMILKVIEVGKIYLDFQTPSKEIAKICLEINPDSKKGYSKILIDLYGSNWDFSEIGRKTFLNGEQNIIPDSEDRINPNIGTSIMQVSVKKGGEPMVFDYMCLFLEDANNLREIDGAKIRREIKF